MLYRWDIGAAFWCAAGITLVLVACGSLRETSAGEAVRTAAAQDAAPAVLTQDMELNDICFASGTDAENALRLGMGNIVLHRVVVEKSGGVQQGWQNAAVYVTDGANVMLNKASVTSSAPGGGVYVQGDNSELEFSDGAVTTTADGAHGVFSDGVLSARDLTVTTSGEGASPVYIQGGQAQIDGGTYTSGGYEAPALYARGKISVQQSELLANNAPVLWIKSGAEVNLQDCSLYGGLAAQDASGEPALLFSGDGTDEPAYAWLSLDGGSLTARDTLFAAQNGRFTLHLMAVELDQPAQSALMRVSDGAQVELIAEDQTLRGNVTVSGDSALTLTLREGSEFMGMITLEDTSTAQVRLAAGTRWSLSGNSTLNGLENHGQIIYNGYAITLRNGTVLRG